ncbi:hypothetical protein AVEN_239268-1 [Araneus ventricosus]|uniref:Uncharacterized protein n=1 Tax=Araneus ventricosus TaxID=182803 RepID=A0A4Y2P316_ARAVE|nr:hypothetical protein AVEN_239268-1 [Araneus ventricosus]
MAGWDVTIRNCFPLGGFIRNKQEYDPDVTEKPADLSEEDWKPESTLTQIWRKLENYRRNKTPSMDESKTLPQRTCRQ